MYRIQLQKLSSTNILFILFLICFLAFGMAYVMETHFKIYGCQMCHYERNIFIFAGVFSLLSLVVLPKRLQYYAIILLGFIFIGNAFFAAYHVAIQQHWASMPSFCPVDNIHLVPSFVRCDKVTFSLFGLSLAVYNSLISIFLAFLCWIWSYKNKSGSSSTY